MKLKKIIIFACIFTYFQCGSGFSAEEIALSLGEQYSVDVQQDSKFSVGNPEVVQVKSLRVRDGKTVLLVRAKHQGYSDLVVFHEKQRRQIVFRVYSKQKGAVLRDVKSALGHATGIEILPSGDRWVVRGEENSIEDHNLVQAFSQSAADKVQSLAHLNEGVRKNAEEKIRAVLKSAGFADLHVRGAGSKIWLEGTLLAKNDEILVLGLAREVFQSVDSHLKLPFESDKIIRFKVRILELLKTANDSNGLLWNQSIPGIITLQQKLLKGNIALDATLNMLARRGYARILSEPMISVNSQGAAELQVGGEIPITLRTKYAQNIVWKQYGLGLKIEVPGSSDTLVRTKLGVEVSSLDLANAVDGIPGIKLNKMQTVVDLSMQKPVFLSGLIQDQSGETESALPLLGSIPVLGALFRSKDFMEKKTELVIAITAERSDANGVPE